MALDIPVRSNSRTVGRAAQIVAIPGLNIAADRNVPAPVRWQYQDVPAGPSSVFDIAKDGQQAISPILFADGHSAKHNFTKALHQDWRYPTEPMKDWIWYQPLIGTNGQPVPNL